ncbi:MAG: sulfatase [Proteobacteria bacterium]|nr:sulfatase [Pseudomonadota bacterium]
MGRLTALLALALLACGAPLPFETPDIILVSIDSLRADHLGSYGYPKPTSPFLDRLADDGVRFENAVSSTSWTLPAHAGLFTGLYDSAHGLVRDGLRLAGGHRTLAERLREAGYRTAGFYSGPYLHPSFGLNQGFDVYRSGMTAMPELGDEAARDFALNDLATHREITGPVVARQVAEWLDALPAETGPVFLFVHLFDVHYDYVPPVEYLSLFDPDYQGTLRPGRLALNPAVHEDMDPRDLEHLVARYDGEIRFTDDTVKWILADFGSHRDPNNTILVVTSDHGDEFFEHGDKGHRRTLYDEVVRVPLIFRWPNGIAGGRAVPDQVRLIDVLPTLLALARVAPGEGVQGRDLSPLLRGGALPPEDALLELYTPEGTIRALRTNETKLFWQNGRHSSVDLANDPAERRHRQAEGPDLRPMRKRLAELYKRSRALREERVGRRAVPSETDPATRERLRSLGYVE